MHHAMADGDGRSTHMGDEPRAELVLRGADVPDLGGLGMLVGEDRAVGAPCDQMRPRPDALELTLEPAREPVAVADGENLELDARGAGVDDEDAAIHGAHPAATLGIERRWWA